MQKEKKKKRETEGERTKNKRRRKRGGFPPPRFDRIIDAPWSIQQDWTGNNGGFEHRSWLHPSPRRPLRPVFFLPPSLPPSVLNWIVAWKMNRLSLSIFSFSFFSLLPPFSPFTHGFRYFVVEPPEPRLHRRKGEVERNDCRWRGERETERGIQEAQSSRARSRGLFRRVPPPCEGTDSSSLAWIEIIHPRAFRFAFNVTKTYGSVYFADEGEGLLNNWEIDPRGFVGTRESSWSSSSNDWSIYIYIFYEILLTRNWQNFSIDQLWRVL